MPKKTKFKKGKWHFISCPISNIEGKETYFKVLQNYMVYYWYKLNFPDKRSEVIDIISFTLKDRIDSQVIQTHRSYEKNTDQYTSEYIFTKMYLKSKEIEYDVNLDDNEIQLNIRDVILDYYEEDIQPIIKLNILLTEEFKDYFSKYFFAPFYGLGNDAVIFSFIEYSTPTNNPLSFNHIKDPNMIKIIPTKEQQEAFKEKQFPLIKTASLIQEIEQS